MLMYHMTNPTCTQCTILFIQDKALREIESNKEDSGGALQLSLPDTSIEGFCNMSISDI